MRDELTQCALQTRLSTLQTIAFHSLQASASASSIPNGLVLGCSAPGTPPAQTLAEIEAVEQELSRRRFHACASAELARRTTPTSPRCADPESLK